MSKTDIIDVDLDQTEVRRKFWRKILRFGLPCASIVLISAGLIGSALYTAAMNKTDVLALSRGYIDALNSRVLSEAAAYLHPARDAAATLASAVQVDPLSTKGRTQFEHMARGLLKRHSQLAALFIGTPNGEFLMIRRNANGTADTKLIRKSPTGTTSVWTRRNSKGEISGSEINKDDPYDPRTRGWFRDALSFEGVSWSQVYIFFTDKTPGITASTSVRSADGAPVAVVGADIYLNSLSLFLRRLQKQARGQLAIVDGTGQVVAFHEPKSVIVNTSKGPRPRLIRELGVPALAQAFDRLRVEGPANSIVEIGGDRYLFGASSLREAVRRDWWLLLLAPENAYLGFVAANSQRALIASSVVIVLSMILAGFLTYQGMVADRSARDLSIRQEKLEVQRRTFSEIGDYSDLPEPTDQLDLRRASETLARSQNARRISIWRIRRGGDSLTCVDAYEAETNGHTEGVIIHADNCGDVFSDLAEGRVFDILDVANDARAVGLNLSYLQSVGTNSLLSIPIVLSDKALGAIWIEDATQKDAEATDRSVAQVVANMLAARFQKVADLQAQTTVSEDESDGESASVSRYHHPQNLPSDGSLRSTSIVELRREDAEKESVSADATVFHGATVLSLKFLDDHALASRHFDQAMGQSHNSGAVMNAVITKFEQAADIVNIPYVKVLTNQVLAVDGFQGEEREAAQRLVQVALSVREQCASIFLASGRGPEFSLGLDTGSVYGAALGDENSPYNVWGDAMRVSNILADTAEPGTIQASEATYELLRGTCVFRRRGAYYLDRLGELTTFTLRGQL